MKSFRLLCGDTRLFPLPGPGTPLILTLRLHLIPPLIPKPLKLVIGVRACFGDVCSLCDAEILKLVEIKLESGC